MCAALLDRLQGETVLVFCVVSLAVLDHLVAKPLGDLLSGRPNTPAPGSLKDAPVPRQCRLRSARAPL
jgi:hypothetical protein